MALGKKREQPPGAPAWMVTYGDAMTLLLCFFVIIVSMSEIKEDERFSQVMQSLRQAFGAYESAVQAVPGEELPTNTLIERLLALQAANRTKFKGETDESWTPGKDFRVTNVRDGIEVVVGGRITFARFSATLKPKGRELIAKTAERLRGYNTKILVRGHATREALPEDSLYEDARDLSYARAAAVAREMVQSGVRPVRLILVAAGDTEPVARQAYTEERRAVNRRVEMLVTEDLIEDYAGSTPAQEREFSDGQ